MGDGPIPARAGEPERDRQHWAPHGAYPRSRGGTKAMDEYLKSRRGLSPLARGNHCCDTNRRHDTRPIPARAGEPRQ